MRDINIDNLRFKPLLVLADNLGWP
jgi:hypothetical protein